jgi:hypothetical protein
MKSPHALDLGKTIGLLVRIEDRWSSKVLNHDLILGNNVLLELQILLNI